MNKLFVLGNGFDLEHKFKTSYADFKNFLITNYSIDANDDEYEFILPNYQTNYRHLEVYNKKEFATFFLKLIDDCSKYIETWQDFEECLGKINWYKIFENDYPLLDKEDEYSFRDQLYFYDGKANSLLESYHILKSFFYDWILSIEIEINDNPSLETSNVIKKFKKLFNKDDLFLTFNYTSTLEKLYKINEVCHIHGSIHQYNNLVVGYGLSEYEFQNDNELFDEVNVVIKSILNEFKKDTCNCYERHIDFFNKLQNISDIYFYGFSFSEVDMFYIQQIKKYTNGNVKIHINNYNKEKDKQNLSKLKMFKYVDLWNI